jgi:hypothetical protein
MQGLSRDGCKQVRNYRSNDLGEEDVPMNDKPGQGAGSSKHQKGGIGYVLLWLLGVPIPVLILIALLRGCA